MTKSEATFSLQERDEILSRHHGGHPLELFPWFRHWRRSLPRDIAYTFIWNFGFAVLFAFFETLANWRLPSMTWLWTDLVIANCIGYTLHALSVAGGCTIEHAVRRAGRIAVTAYYMALGTVGVLIGFWIAAGLLGREILPRLGDHRWFLAVALTSLAVSVVMSIVFFWRERSALADAALEREQRRAADIQREATAANLRALQAQIEPHFLFNTLANVTSLIEAEPATAKHMLESFIRFLRASLAATRRSRSALADEFALVSDFLAVLKIRMRDRLEFAMVLPPELAAVELPPMLLQPLVENAIRHGLEPKLEGGRVTLEARRERDRLILEVRDTGVGFADATTGGVGLANVRNRLQLAQGEAARLTVRDNSPCGTIVAIEWPLEET